jgi:hypothetical protein
MTFGGIDIQVGFADNTGSLRERGELPKFPTYRILPGYMLSIVNGYTDILPYLPRYSVYTGSGVESRWTGARHKRYTHTLMAGLA